MTSLLDKARNIVLSNAHDLLDAVIDMNSIGSIRQHVRDLESARDKIADEAAVAEGRAASIESDIKDLRATKQATTSNIELLLGDGDESNDHHAMPLAERVMQLEENIVAKGKELAVQRALAADLEDARSKISTQHMNMLRKLNELESMERATEAREQAASALNAAASVTQAAGAASVDSVVDRLQDRDAVSRSRFERAMAGIGKGGSEDAVRESQAAALLASLRAKAEDRAAK